MFRKMTAAVSALTLVALLPSGIAYAADISGNPGFEVAGVGGATDSDLWTEFTGGPAGTASVRDGSMPAAGNWAHRITAVGDVTAGAVAGINQNSVADVGLVSLEELTTVTAGFQWKGDLGPGGVASASLRVLNGAGAIVADTGVFGLPSTGGVYTAQSLPVLNVPAFGAAPNDTYAAFLEIVVQAGAFDGSFADGFVDEVRLDGTLIPEPTSALLVMLGAALLRRRA